MHASALFKGYGNWQQKHSSCWKFMTACHISSEIQSGKN